MTEHLVVDGDVPETQVLSSGHWGQLVGDVYTRVHVRETDRSFSGRLRNVDVGGVNVSRVRVGKHRLQRLADQITLAESPKLVLCAQVSGFGTVIQNGRQTILGPGDLTVYDTSMPFELEFDGTAECVGMVVPWGSIAPAPEVSRRLVASYMPAADPVVRTVSRVIVDSEEGLAEMPVSARRRFAHHIVQVFETLCWTRLNETAPSGDSAAGGNSRMAPVLLFIEENLADPALDVKMVAGAFFVSVRTMHEWAAQAGVSIATWIRARRLERSRADLALYPEMPIAAIAVRNGFLGASYFSHIFRESFGMSPSTYRSGVRE